MLTKASGITGVKHHAVWNNQLDLILTGEGVSFDMPAIFPELIFNPSILLGTGISQSSVLWRLHILHQQLDAGDGTLDQNLDIDDLRDLVKVTFTRYQPKNCTPLAYVGDEPDYSHNNVYHHIIDFTCTFIDTKGSPLDPDSTEWNEVDASGYTLTIIDDPSKPFL